MIARKIRIDKVLLLLSAATLLAIFLLNGSAQAGEPLPSGRVQNLEVEGSKVAPEAQKAVDSLQDGEMLTVIVKLRSQANLSHIKDRDRQVRISKVIKTLQNQANATQQHIRALLERKQAAGQVATYESFWVVNGLAVTATAEVIEELAARPEVAVITPNEADIVPLAQSSGNPPEPNLTVVNGPALWDLGYRGGGIVVANMDSGVYLNHPDLVNRWRGGTNSWFDPNEEHPDGPFDVSGHGTWTMGVMVGGDAGTTAIGLAPDAQWIAVKIFNDRGEATVAGIHAGFQWLLDPDGDPDTPDTPYVVNNSWSFQNPVCDLEFELDLQSLRAAGILPIFAAGNSGPNPGFNTSPANNPSAFAVGATDNNDQMYYYSGRGPTQCSGAGTFPDLVAPGVNIHTSSLYGTYTFATGTSMAAPHAAGGLALLLQAFPNLLAGEQEAALINGALDLGPAGPDNDFGYGRLDLQASYQWLQDPGPTPTPTSTPTSTLTPTPTPIPSDQNLALNQPVSVSSSADPDHDGAQAVDGILASFWKTRRAKGKNKLPAEWITVDLGSSVSIGQVTLEWDVNYATAYTIDVSADNNNWQTIYSTTSGDGGSDTASFAETTARFVRLEATAWTSGSLRNWLREFEIYTASGGSQPPPTPTPTDTPDATATPTPDATATPTPDASATMHIGDLAGVSGPDARNRWQATVTITVHDAGENPVAGVTVEGRWSNGVSGGGSCVTDDVGSCSVNKGKIKGNVSSVTFTVDTLSHGSLIYQPLANHNGNTVNISKP